MGQPLWKTGWQVLQKSDVELPCDSAIPFLGMCLIEREVGTQTGPCTPTFTGLFTGTGRWKQPKCMSLDEWISKSRYSQMMVW